MRRRFPESKRCCGVFVLVSVFFLFAADFLECGGNFRRNASRQKFPPQEVLGMGVGQTQVPFFLGHPRLFAQV